MTTQNAKIGEEFSLLLKGEDADDIDRNNLMYKLEDAPFGMNISSTTGKITWTPESKHVGKNSFFAILSDGTDEAVISIDVLVEEGEGEGFSIAILIAVIAVVAVICAVIGIVIFLRKRQNKMFEGEEGSDEEFLKKEDLTEDEEKLRKQMKELKELTGVPLTVADAHAHDKDHHEASYEELYGSAPEKMKEETASTEETKEYIGEQIQELGKMELKEGEENTET